MCLGFEHGISPWTLEDDGKLHSYTLILALRLDALPTSALPLFTGGPAAGAGGAAGGRAAEAVCIYKNGGVGALGQCGTAETAVKPGRFVWLVIARKPGELLTFVNGRRCAEIKLEAKSKAAGAAAGDPAAGGGGVGGCGSGAAAAAAAKKAEVNAAFAIDPKVCALLPGLVATSGTGGSAAAAAGGAGGHAQAGGGFEPSEREACGVLIKYVALRLQTWNNDDKVRAAAARGERAALAAAL